MEKITVIGSGSMGHGIAQVFAMSGHEVTIVDLNKEILQKALEKIKWSLSVFAQKGRITPEDAEKAVARINLTTNYEKAVKNADLVEEAVPENLQLKKQLFAKLDKIAPLHTIFASNTSTLSITEMGESTKRSDKIVGMHFFNPPQLTGLVEVVKGEKTSQETIDMVVHLVEKTGKTPLVVRKDVRGFIVNRILVAVLNEAFWAYYRGEATREEVDASVRHNGGFPLGWFELADISGLDVIHDIGKVLYQAYGERFKPCSEIIEPLINEGKLGRKAGFGFYNWTKDRPTITFNVSGKYDAERSWLVAVNEAAWVIHDNVAGPREIDTGMKLGICWPTGPCEYADTIGIDVVLKKLKDLYAKYDMEIYRPCPLLEEYANKGWLGKKTGKGLCIQV